MNFVYGCKQYTDRDRMILCKLHNRRGAMVCPRRDRYGYCQRAAKDENQCWRRPGLFQMNCPVACGNCEGHCYNSPYENELCQYIADNRKIVFNRPKDCKNRTNIK
uniref:ShKT domain-containing protein n=1 Tax=Romanomermis culicivorax TaxID=13658 RepID=A0A915L425_ROMCU